MIYIYDLLLNYQDNGRLVEFFEWSEDDILEHIKILDVDFGNYLEKLYNEGFVIIMESKVQEGFFVELPYSKKGFIFVGCSGDIDDYFNGLTSDNILNVLVKEGVKKNFFYDLLRDKHSIIVEAICKADTNTLRKVIRLCDDERLNNIILFENEEKFLEAINDDLNMPLAMSYVWEMAKFEKKNPEVVKLLAKFDTVLGIKIDEVSDGIKEVEKV